MIRGILYLAAIAVACAVPAAADSLDPGDDTAAGTRNELVHGADQLHDLRGLGGDTDWYRLSQKAYESYEVLVDTTSSAIGPTLLVELVASDGTTVLKSSAAVSSLGYSRSLRFSNEPQSTDGPPTPIDNQYIRIRSGQCTNCSANDVYRIRFFNTTLPLARWNNSSGQYTYVLGQNPTEYTINARIFFWDDAGTLKCFTRLFALGPKDEVSLDEDKIYIHGVGLTPVCDGPAGTPPPELEDLAGHAKMISDARYGDLRARGASVDPFGTLWEFETEMPSRPY